MDYLHESALSIYRRRRRLRALLTMTCVAVLLLGSVVYASSHVMGWVGTATPKALANASCNGATSSQALKPGDVTINVYNSTARLGLAATVASSLQKQGFSIVTIDNDPLGKALLGVGEIRHGQSGLEGAKLAALRLPGAKLVLDGRMDASVDMVVGKRFRALKVPPKVAPAKKAKATAHC